MRPYIGDGHDITFYVEGRTGLYPPCRFRGRLMGHHQSAAVLQQAKDDAKNEDKIFAAAIADRIVGCSYLDEESKEWKPLDDHNGNKLPINAETIGGLAYFLFCRLRDIVLGMLPADIDPATCEAAKTPEQDEKN